MCVCVCERERERQETETERIGMNRFTIIKSEKCQELAS